MPFKCLIRSSTAHWVVKRLKKRRTTKQHLPGFRRQSKLFKGVRYHYISYANNLPATDSSYFTRHRRLWFGRRGSIWAIRGQHLEISNVFLEKVGTTIIFYLRSTALRSLRCCHILAHLLKGGELTVKTDHLPLIFVFAQRFDKASRRQGRNPNACRSSISGSNISEVMKIRWQTLLSS